MMIIEAIKRAGSEDTVKIKDELAKTKEYQAVSGIITLNETHDAVKSCLLYTSMENSTFTVVNFLAQKDLDARASLYLGIDNLGNYHDYNKDVYGRMYRVGINCKF